MPTDYEFADEMLRIARTAAPPGLRIEGELDAARHTVLDRLLLIAGVEFQRAHLDFSQLEFIDLGALNLIIDHARGLKEGHAFVLDALPVEVVRILANADEDLPPGLVIGRDRTG